jgi:Domain of unknown function (DUF5668)
MNANDRNSRGCDGGAIACGLALVAIGVILLMRNAGLIGVRLADLWPIALIAIGIEGLFRSRRAA